MAYQRNFSANSPSSGFPGPSFLSLLAGVWVGLLLGVSFLATMAKFEVVGLSLPLALDIGRHTFQQLVRAEWVLTLTALICLFRVRPPKWIVAGWLFTLSLFVWEAAWLLPTLDRRVSLLLAGTTPGKSIYHLVFIATELVRIAVLLVLGLGIQKGSLRSV